MRFNTAATLALIPGAFGITHPGLLHTDDDFARIRSLVEGAKEPWATGWGKLSYRTNGDYQPSPQASVCRGQNAGCTQNYQKLYKDIHAAYANALRWKVTGETEFADAAVRILDGWSSTLQEVTGNADRYLAAGIYGYQLANAAEVLRDYAGWKGLDATAGILRNIFYPLNHRFLQEHNDAKVDHYWANWDLCNLASIHAIGVLSDNQTMIDEAIDYFKNGGGNGAIEKMIWTVHEEEGSGKPLGQGQEAGRDQGHAVFDFSLLGVLAQQSYNQGDDLFEYLDNRLLAGAEYAFKYNAGHEVPFDPYANSDFNTPVISNAGRGNIRPISELFFAHYTAVKGLNASWTGEYRDIVLKASGGAEGGGGDYGPDSGGYDQLGFGTILFRRE